MTPEQRATIIAAWPGKWDFYDDIVTLEHPPASLHLGVFGFHRVDIRRTHDESWRVELKRFRSQGEPTPPLVLVTDRDLGWALSHARAMLRDEVGALLKVLG